MEVTIKVSRPVMSDPTASTIPIPTLTVERKVVLVIGATGAGKSTLLNALINESVEKKKT